jgi:hypothetical protein
VEVTKENVPTVADRVVHLQAELEAVAHLYKQAAVGKHLSSYVAFENALV